VEEAEAEAAVEVNPALQEWVEPRPAVRANPNFSAE
jgi:hypothetical protein